jgi:hypothetical protein
VDVIGTKCRVVSLEPYVGPNAYLWGGRVRIAKFDDGSGMIIGDDEWYGVATR